jgi:4'-phosphopantetheinyl transferase
MYNALRLLNRWFEVKIFALNKLELMGDLTFRKLLANVSNEKQERIKKLVKTDDVQRVLLADILVRSVLANELKVSSKTIEFKTNKYGKPQLLENCFLHFNVSHSGDWVVCAVDNEPIGIDIEKIIPMDLEIAAHFFADEEYKMLMAKSPEDRNDFFFDLWTLKESYVKAVGRGMTISLKSFAVNFLQSEEITIKSENKLTNWTLKQYNLDPEYKMSVCAASKSFPEEIILKKLEDIYSE